MDCRALNMDVTPIIEKIVAVRKNLLKMEFDELQFNYKA